jgi:type I restriction enzyme S subunit
LVLSESNDVIIPASGETQIDIATAACVLKNNVALSGDINIIKSKINGIFLSYYLNSKCKYDIASISQGKSVVHLYANQLKTLKVKYPCPVEQQKIAEFLTTIDDKIKLAGWELEKAQEFKKGLLQQMFV